MTDRRPPDPLTFREAAAQFAWSWWKLAAALADQTPLTRPLSAGAGNRARDWMSVAITERAQSVGLTVALDDYFADRCAVCLAPIALLTVAEYDGRPLPIYDHREPPENDHPAVASTV